MGPEGAALSGRRSMIDHDLNGPAQAGPVVSGVSLAAEGVWAIDTHYVRPALDASHLVVHNGRAAFVDTGAAPAVPLLLEALRHADLAAEDVDYILLTHIHLDHAGGAGALLAHLPRAEVIVHPRGMGHLIEPARLIAATRDVYGEAVYERLYGEILPIPASRIRATQDGETISLGGRHLACLHTPGHALHHQVFVDEQTQGVFTGDTFGISYREFDVESRAFILPTTTPSQFDPEQLLASIDRVLDLRPAHVYLTHYSRVSDVERLGADLKAAISAYVQIVTRHSDATDAATVVAEELMRYTFESLDRHGDRSSDELRRRLLGPDMRLNADGLLAWIRRRRAS